MSEERISLNIGLFKDRVIELRDSIKSVDGKMDTEESFDKTNIKPFVDDLENTIKALEVLMTYQEKFDYDLDVLENIGDKIREQDLHLSKIPQHDVKDGPQPIRV